MAIVNSTITTGKNYIVQLGDDAGAYIKISSSTFETSRFCKGMIVFKKRPILGEYTGTIEIIDINDVLTQAVDKSIIDI